MNAATETILIEKVIALHGIKMSEVEAVVTLLLNNLLNQIAIEGNKNFLNLLIKGMTLTIGKEDKTIRFIDFDDIGQNSFIVTNQYSVQI